LTYHRKCRLLPGAGDRRPNFTEAREPAMADQDKLNNKGEELRGKVKEGAGRATDDPELERQGQRDQSKADVKQAGEKIKDSIKGLGGKKDR